MLRNLSFLKFALSLVLSMAGTLIAQQPTANEPADTLFAAGKFEEAAQSYQEIVAKAPGNGPAWQSLGES